MSNAALKICATPQHLRPTTAPKVRRMCGCFNCFTIFEASEVLAMSGTDVVPSCPKCGQDTVLDGTTVPSLDQQLLCEVNGYWFAKE